MARTDSYSISSPSPMPWYVRGLSLAFGVLMLTGCKASPSGAAVVVAQDAAGASTQPGETNMWMTIGERRFSITLADNAAARAFAAQFPLTLDMAELNGNEKHADLLRALPTDAGRPGMIYAGDLMLYGSNTVVVFYATFRSSYSYTRLGRVDDPTDMVRALGQHGSRVVFSLK